MTWIATWHLMRADSHYSPVNSQMHRASGHVPRNARGDRSLRTTFPGARQGQALRWRDAQALDDDGACAVAIQRLLLLAASAAVCEAQTGILRLTLLSDVGQRPRQRMGTVARSVAAVAAP